VTGAVFKTVGPSFRGGRWVRPPCASAIRNRSPSPHSIRSNTSHRWMNGATVPTRVEQTLSTTLRSPAANSLVDQYRMPSPFRTRADASSLRAVASAHRQRLAGCASQSGRVSTPEVVPPPGPRKHSGRWHQSLPCSATHRGTTAQDPACQHVRR
jgi:hypothetical protein